MRDGTNYLHLLSTNTYTSAHETFHIPLYVSHNRSPKLNIKYKFKMSISIRESIRWLPDTASEPTTTIVLTSPGHRFVDIRILKDANNKQPLDWAFAGISSSEYRNGVRHCTWQHVVDSRTRTPGTVVDEGDIFPRADGHTLETGQMTNPTTGIMTDYEEIWTDLDASGLPTMARCIVLELRDDEREERGMVIHLGSYCQGIVRVGDDFAAERWLLADGKWECRHRVGHLWIPGPEFLRHITLSPGEEIRSEDTVQKWRVVEISDL
ncbi:hypothetical protein GGS21DRAFT_483444 [Xylaria nigripes]|nr:hypothetical protein GGS21DRAFT_483444 [Xylaria nigripes]